MQTEPLYPLPSRAKTVVKAASDHGWTVYTTWSEGPPANVVIRVSREGRPPAYGAWLGDKWSGGATRQVDPFSYKTLNLKQFLAYIEGTHNPHAAADADSGSEPDRVEVPDAGGEANG